MGRFNSADVFLEPGSGEKEKKKKNPALALFRLRVMDAQQEVFHPGFLVLIRADPTEGNRKAGSV